jgi:hypothetical protein
MTVPTKSVRLRRIHYAENHPENPIDPTFYRNQDPLLGVDVNGLDPVLAHNPNQNVLGYTWDAAKAEHVRDDYTPPNTSFAFYPEPSHDHQSTVAVVMESTEPHSTFMSRLDGGQYEVSNGIMYYSGINTGSHTIDGYAIDMLGNVDASPASTTWFTTGTLT